jgi:hypothetical protein
MMSGNRLALAVLSAAQLMVILDGTIVTVALPAIQHDLGFGQAGLVWVTNAFLVPFGGLLLFSGGSATCSAPGGSSCPGWPCSPPPRCCAGSPPVRRR